MSAAAAFIAGAILAWFARGALDKAIVEIATRALVSAVGKKRVAAEEKLGEKAQ